MRKNKEYGKVELKYGGGGTQGKEKMKHAGQSEWIRVLQGLFYSTEERTGCEALKRCMGGVI